MSDQRRTKKAEITGLWLVIVWAIGTALKAMIGNGAFNGLTGSEADFGEVVLRWILAFLVAGAALSSILCIFVLVWSLLERMEKRGGMRVAVASYVSCFFICLVMWCFFLIPRLWFEISWCWWLFQYPAWVLNCMVFAFAGSRVARSMRGHPWQGLLLSILLAAFVCGSQYWVRLILLHANNSFREYELVGLESGELSVWAPIGFLSAGFTACVAGAIFRSKDHEHAQDPSEACA
jgi:hypothetical protein